MTQQTINLGTADKGNGDVLRTAFGKVNANFAELYNQIATSVVVGATAPTAPEEGALWWNSESGRMYVYFGTAWVDASPVDGAGISSTNELVNGGNTVSLGSDGKLTLPNGVKITPIAFAGIDLEVGTKIWNFGADGSLTLPLQGKIMPVGDVNSFLTFNWGDDVELKAGDNLYLSGSVATIRTNGNANQWIFGTNGSLTFPDSTAQTTAWTGITGFGEGFSLTAADKIVTNKLYSTNLTQPTQHYRLELDTNGVIILPDQSIINGSYMRAIHGSYAGLAAGPDQAHNEDSWMWVDADGAWIATKYSTDAFTWKFDNNGTLTFPDSTVQTTAYPGIFTGYDYEIHVSQTDGNDTTGNGDLLKPVASITKALTLVTGERRTIIIHPGTYTENPTITVQYTVLTTLATVGGSTLISGTLTTTTGCTISGLKITNLTSTAASGTGNVNILNCDISGTLTKSGSGLYTLVRFTDCGAATISGSGLVDIYGGTTTFVTVSNAAANVLIKNGTTVAPVVTAGSLSLVQTVVIAAVTNAVTTSAGTVITLANSQILNSALNNVAPVVLNGFYSILNCVFDKPNSTLVPLSGTGGSTNSVDYFQYINADRLILTPATPVHSYGVAGDKTGMLAFDATYIYYCTADYVNNTTDIWKRTAHGAGTW